MTISLAADDPSVCHTQVMTTKEIFCGGTDQACKTTKECLMYCYSDCFPCNSKANCDILVGFGLVAAEGDAKCWSIFRNTTLAGQ